MRYPVIISAVLLLAACEADVESVDSQADSVTTVTDVAVKTDAQTNERTKQASKLIETALAGTQGYDITESLTTEVGQRLAGTEAEARARDWAVKKFKDIGLENVRVEPFTIPGWERGDESAYIVSPYPQKLEITTLGYSVATPSNVIRSVGTDSHRFPHTGGMRYAPDFPKIPIAAMSSPDADQMERIFKRGEKVVVKLLLSPINTGQRPSGNVIGEIIGTEKPEEIVLISGHLDSWDLGTGAIDDGAGIGISAGAAQVIIETGLKPKRTIRVVAYGAEEIGLLGGFAYRDKYIDELPNHMMATESDFGAVAPYEVQYNWDEGREDMQDLADLLDIPLVRKDTTGGPDIGPIKREGVPAMRLQQDGTDYFDLHHTHDDTFDKIDPDEMAKNTAAFAAMAWITANSDSDYRDNKDK